jgi:hypothetical protein
MRIVAVEAVCVELHSPSPFGGSARAARRSQYSERSVTSIPHSLHRNVPRSSLSR